MLARLQNADHLQRYLLAANISQCNDIQGNGPVHLVGSHCVEKMMEREEEAEEEDSQDDDDDDSSDERGANKEKSKDNA